MGDLPPRQAAVLNFVRGYQVREGTSPTIYEIAEHFRFTPANAVKLLRKLALRGELLIPFYPKPAEHHSR